MTPSTDLNRRGLLKAGIGAAAIVGGFSACASGGQTGAAKPSGNVASASVGSNKSNPFGMDEKLPGETLIPSQGFGLKWLSDMVVAFNKKWPDVKVTEDASKDMNLSHQARFTQGNPPDLVFPTGLDMLTLCKQGQVTDLKDFFEAPAWDGNGKVKDNLAAGWELASTWTGEKYEGLPFTLNVYGLWYSNKVFKEKGWTPPKTWDELLKLAPEMVKAGIPPIGYDGVHWSYPGNLLMAMMIKNGGSDMIVSIDQLEPNAWKNPAVKNAAQAIEEFRAKGFFMPGSEGLNHTQSQTYWAQGKCALIPVGGWLENESAEVIPKDYDMAMIPSPSLSGDKLPRETILGSPGAATFVPTKAKNQKFGLEFLRFMSSKEASQIFTKNTKSMTSGRPEWAEEVAETPGLKSQLASVKAAGKNLVDFKFGWYGKTYTDPIGAAILELFKGGIKADEFVARCQKSADDYAAKPENKPKKRTIG